MPLDGVADPSDATYVPRPEWYFLSLFQLLKYFPGPLEPVATLVIPGAVVTFIALVPFLDRRPERHPARRPLVMLAFGLLAAGAGTLTYLGLKDSPTHVAAGQVHADGDCRRRVRGRPALRRLPPDRRRRQPGFGDAADEGHRLGDRPHGRSRDHRARIPQGAAGGMRESQARSVISYLQRVRAGGVAPSQVEHKPGIVVYGTWCVRCHTIDGEGVKSGPDLTYAGEKRDAKWLHAWITDPAAVDAKADMPAFEDRLTPEELTAVAEFLARASAARGGSLRSLSGRGLRAWWELASLACRAKGNGS